MNMLNENKSLRSNYIDKNSNSNSYIKSQIVYLSDIRQRVYVSKKICNYDIHCRNKKCKDSHPERKRLNICQFDVFFLPDRDSGCHFEDCTFVHIRRDEYEKKKKLEEERKEREFDDLVHSMVDFLFEDDRCDIKYDLHRLFCNLNIYPEMENEVVFQIFEFQKLLPEIQHLYNSSFVVTKEDYGDFISQCVSLLNNVIDKYTKILKSMEKIVIYFPHTMDQTNCLLQEVNKIYSSIIHIKENIFQEYYSTIHLYPDPREIKIVRFYPTYDLRPFFTPLMN